MESSPPVLCDLDEGEEIRIELANESGTERQEENLNRLDNFRQVASESCILPAVLTSEYIEIAPVEDKIPRRVILDKNCEELAFPHLLSKSQFRYTTERETKLSPVKYLNQRLLNYKQIFSSSVDYIFFIQFVLQQLNLNSKINIAMKKFSSSNVTAGMLSINFKKTVETLVTSDKGFLFMNTIKGTSAFWKRFQLEILAIIRQLGSQTFFMTLSCADLHWIDLIANIFKLKRQNISEEHVKNMSYFQKCEILHENPVFVALHFQYRFEVFFTEILMASDLLGEFQFRGSPHICSFLCILNPVKLSKETIKEYAAFLEQTIHSFLPDQTVDKDLYDLVKLNQTHQHSKSCRKYKSKPCRYNFGSFFTDKTIVAVPLNQSVDILEKSKILTKCNNILLKVKQYIDEFLDPGKASYVNNLTVNEALKLLYIAEVDYYDALSLSPTSDYEIRLWRPPNSCFINNYNPIMSKAWMANMDL